MTITLNSIICDDCRNVLKTIPDKQVDITITSPPYNQLGKSRRLGHGWNENQNIWKGRKWLKILKSDVMYEDDMPEAEYQTWLNDILQECLRITKGLVWFNHKTRYRNKAGIHPLSFLKAPLYSEIIWACEGSIALNCKRFAPSHEAIYGFGEPHYWNDSSNKLLSVWEIARAASNGHPTNFPEEIPKRLINASCPPGGLVFDPFVGSGTTCAAAKSLGRSYIGIELNSNYCKLAETRIANTHEQLELCVL